MMDDEKETMPMSVAASNYKPKACKACGYAEGGLVNPSPEDSGDMVDSIMAKRMSEGGMMANDTEAFNPDAEPAQYDELVKDDDLDFSYDGKNSGDEDGDEALDEEDDDVVSSVMKSRKKKDKNPKPA
jgi:hypothetical protein